MKRAAALRLTPFNGNPCPILKTSAHVKDGIITLKLQAGCFGIERASVLVGVIYRVAGLNYPIYQPIKLKNIPELDTVSARQELIVQRRFNVIPEEWARLTGCDVLQVGVDDYGALGGYVDTKIPTITCNHPFPGMLVNICHAAQAYQHSSGLMRLFGRGRQTGSKGVLQSAQRPAATPLGKAAKLRLYRYL